MSDDDRRWSRLSLTYGAADSNMTQSTEDCMREHIRDTTHTVGVSKAQRTVSLWNHRLQLSSLSQTDRRTSRRLRLCTQRHSVHVIHTHDIQQKVHRSHHIRDRHVWVLTCSKSSSRDVWGLSVPLPASYSVHCWRGISSLSFSRVNHNVVDRTSSAR